MTIIKKKKKRQRDEKGRSEGAGVGNSAASNWGDLAKGGLANWEGAQGPAGPVSISGCLIGRAQSSARRATHVRAEVKGEDTASFFSLLSLARMIYVCTACSCKYACECVSTQGVCGFPCMGVRERVYVCVNVWVYV